MKSCKLIAMLFVTLFSSAAFAANCSVDIEANDAMQFNTKAIEISKSCKDFTVNLKHTGSLAKSIMGHNVVIASAADEKAIIADGGAAGESNNYIKAGDARVVAHTKLVGSGEKDSVKFSVSKLAAGTDYVFFCSFPGHAMMMKGTVKLV
ncbi:MAG: azurin [Methylophilaceae bacterium]|uniref:azurin n=1 Tax=Methylovorus sp. MM2 TaxID=1848038 RepID=UPI0007DFE75F|nr:azurin [Methylovorus sp. MM2]OAM51907.1 azurin [Methylovorus sp. MM2]